MTLSDTLSSNEYFQKKLYSFFEKYGISGLEQAMQLYIDSQSEYICRTKLSISKIRISDIYYLEIHEHRITIHTIHNTFQKYGTLNNELKTLSSHGFLKCSNRCLVSMDKVQTIQDNDIHLINGDVIHMTRQFAPKVITAFSKTKKFISK